MREQGADARLSMGKNDVRALRRKNGSQARQPAEPIRPLRSFLGAHIGATPPCDLDPHLERVDSAPRGMSAMECAAVVAGGDKLEVRSADGARLLQSA